MINAIGSILTSSTLTNIAQTASAQVTTETAMKAIGRPGFVLIDNNIQPETKRYAATKELLHQISCLTLYALLVVPVFQKQAFNLGAKIFDKSAGFAKFKNPSEYLKYRKYAEKPFQSDRINNNKIDRLFNEELRIELKTKENPETFNRIKGTIELGNIVGSVFGLAILAPKLEPIIIHPCMRFLGLEEKNKESEEQNKINTVA